MASPVEIIALTDANTKKLTCKKIVDLIQNKLYDNLSTAKLVKICCIDGFVDFHDIVLRHFEYFAKLFNGSFKEEEIKLPHKQSTIDYFKRILYRNENIDIFMKVDLIDLFIFMDYIRIPIVFIKYIFKQMQLNLDDPDIIKIMSALFEKNIRMPKSIIKQLLEKCNHANSRIFVNLVVKYLPDHAYDLIERLAENRRKHLLTFLINKNNDNIDLNDFFFIRDMPKNMIENIIKVDKKYIYNGAEGYKYIVLHIYMNDENSMINLFNHYAKTYPKESKWFNMHCDKVY